MNVRPPPQALAPMRAPAPLPADAFETNPVPTFVVDAAHVVTHLNQACADMLGVRAQDVIGTRTLGRIFYGHDRPLLADLVIDGAAAPTLRALYPGRVHSLPQSPDALEAEHYFPQLGTQGLWLHFTATALRDGRGRLLGAIETLRDITERKRAENARAWESVEGTTR